MSIKKVIFELYRKLYRARRSAIIILFYKAVWRKQEHTWAWRQGENRHHTTRLLTRRTSDVCFWIVGTSFIEVVENTKESILGYNGQKPNPTWKDFLSLAHGIMSVIITLIFTPTVSKASLLRNTFLGVKLPSSGSPFALLRVRRMNNFSHSAIWEFKNHCISSWETPPF